MVVLLFSLSEQFHLRLCLLQILFSATLKAQWLPGVTFKTSTFCPNPATFTDVQITTMFVVKHHSNEADGVESAQVVMKCRHHRSVLTGHKTASRRNHTKSQVKLSLLF